MWSLVVHAVSGFGRLATILGVLERAHIASVFDAGDVVHHRSFRLEGYQATVLPA